MALTPYSGHMLIGQCHRPKSSSCHFAAKVSFWPKPSCGPHTSSGPLSMM